MMHYNMYYAQNVLYDHIIVLIALGINFQERCRVGQWESSAL